MNFYNVKILCLQVLRDFRKVYIRNIKRKEVIVEALRMVKILKEETRYSSVFIDDYCALTGFHIKRVLEWPLETADGLTSFSYSYTSNLVQAIRKVSFIEYLTKYDVFQERQWSSCPWMPCLTTQLSDTA